MVQRATKGEPPPPVRSISTTQDRISPINNLTSMHVAYTRAEGLSEGRCLAE